MKYIKYINKYSKVVDNNLAKRIKKLQQLVSNKQCDHHMLPVRIISNQDDKELFLITHYKKCFNIPFNINIDAIISRI
jgi:hypothetical protein